MEASLPPGGPYPSKKSNSLFIVRFLLNLENNIFICVPMIIEIDFYEYGPPYPPGAPPPSLKKVRFFIYCAILMKFETRHFHMLTYAFHIDHVFINNN